MRTRPVLTALAISALLASPLAGCTPAGVAPSPSATESPTPDPLTIGPVHPVGEPTAVATGLKSPWSMLRLASGSTLISERNIGVVKELTPSGTLRDVGHIPGVVHAGEGGLLGLEFVRDNGDWLYAYFTTEVDNRIDKFPLFGGPGNYSLGDGVEILTGIAKANNHNGGRIKLGPDGKLYATVGDAANRPNSQNLDSLNGKILRMNLDGSIPTDNPFPGRLIYSYGHRNPQGITWDSSGQLWAAEFGQNTWDEFNKIVPGGNYGWPIVEGKSTDPRFINPVYEWPTKEASPSGLTYVRDTFFLAALGGRRVWALYPSTAHDPVQYFAGTYGRIRDVAPGPNGTLWILTNNTDGRGTPGPDDDRILQVQLSPGT
jgi:glucose/arabinose dehydrogenase